MLRLLASWQQRIIQVGYSGNSNRSQDQVYPEPLADLRPCWWTSSEILVAMFVIYHNYGLGSYTYLESQFSQIQRLTFSLASRQHCINGFMFNVKQYRDIYYMISMITRQTREIKKCYLDRHQPKSYGGNNPTKAFCSSRKWTHLSKLQ